MIISRIKTIIPARMIIRPFIVQEGLLYINELWGPTYDSDCAVKTKPANTSTIPKISIKIFILLSNEYGNLDIYMFSKFIIS
ncbi:MAG: hypothetical protein QOK88_07955 [Nitrososphaeraceae archaeon]|nr:hypothetical protein [Nitrososphaeraceae archaeon]